jgi:hypothetical protein
LLPASGQQRLKPRWLCTPPARQRAQRGAAYPPRVLDEEHVALVDAVQPVAASHAGHDEQPAAPAASSDISQLNGSARKSDAPNSLRRASTAWADAIGRAMSVNYSPARKAGWRRCRGRILAHNVDQQGTTEAQFHHADPVEQ